MQQHKRTIMPRRPKDLEALRQSLVQRRRAVVGEIAALETELAKIDTEFDGLRSAKETERAWATVDTLLRFAGPEGFSSDELYKELVRQGFNLKFGTLRSHLSRRKKKSEIDNNSPSGNWVRLIKEEQSSE